jgi:serine/threonine-protein kinase RsbW
LKKTATYHISVGASTKNLAAVRSFVAQHAKAQGFSEKAVSDVCLAVDEAYTNIIKHAYKFDPTKKVEVDLEFDSEQICVSLIDTGESFDKSNYAIPDIPKQIKNKKRGGMGVYLIQKLMDRVNYNTRDSENEIKMYKKKKKQT